MDVIRKLKEHKILKEHSLVESIIEKSWMGSPVHVKSTLIVKELKNNYCLCEEYREASSKEYKIEYFNVMTVDGMNPKELAAVYGLVPKTERFKRRQEQ